MEIRALCLLCEKRTAAIHWRVTAPLLCRQTYSGRNTEFGIINSQQHLSNSPLREERNPPPAPLPYLYNLHLHVNAIQKKWQFWGTSFLFWSDQTPASDRNIIQIVKSNNVQTEIKKDFKEHFFAWDSIPGTLQVRGGMRLEEWKEREREAEESSSIWH